MVCPPPPRALSYVLLREVLGSGRYLKVEYGVDKIAQLVMGYVGSIRSLELRGSVACGAEGGSLIAYTEAVQWETARHWPLQR